MNILIFYRLTLLIAIISLTASTCNSNKPNNFINKMQKVLAKYLEIQSTLAKDSFIGIQKNGQDIYQLTSSLKVPAKHPKVAQFAQIPINLQSASKKIASAKEIKTARDFFKELSTAMIKWALVSRPDNIQVIHCPMAKASWLQKNGPIKNPYYGARMLSCGEVVE